MQPETSDKNLKPLDASQPASADQKAIKVKPWPNSSNPSASPAAVANTPASCPRGAVKQDQPKKPPKPDLKDEKIKEAALRRAEVLSILYKHGAYIESEEHTKKAALRAVIKAHGISKVANAIGMGQATPVEPKITIVPEGHDGMQFGEQRGDTFAHLPSQSVLEEALMRIIKQRAAQPQSEVKGLV